MRNAVRTLLFTSVLTSQPVLAQSSNQSTNEISLTCRVQVVNKNVSNYGQIYETFYRIRFNPPQIINQDGTTMSALINDNEIRWVHGYINRLSGSITLGESYSVTGKCEQAPTHRKF